MCRLDAAPRRLACAALAAAALLGGCAPEPRGADPRGDAGARWTMPERAACPGRYATPPAAAGALEEPLLAEASGLAASPRHAGVVWLHNDAGDGSDRLYAAGADGRALARLKLRGVDLVDAEDLAAAPCPGGDGPCLWVADTGNNGLDRADQAVFAVREPDAQPAGDLSTGQVWRLPVRFPGGAVNSEAMAVLPDASALYLFEKTAAARARVFRYAAPWRRDEAVVVEEVGSLAAPGLEVPRGRELTGAALHPGGGRLVLRTYSAVAEYRFSPPLAPAALAGAVPALVLYGDMGEPQGEAVGYDGTGRGLLTVSEGAGAVLHAYACP